MDRNRPNVLLLLASLLMSLLIWLATFPQNMPAMSTRTFPVRLTYANLPPNLVVVDIPERITLRARGPANRLDQIESAELEAIVPLDEAQPGKTRYQVVVVPTRYKQYFTDRELATITIEQVVTKQIPVEVETIGQLQDSSLVLDDTLFEPTVVSVSGAQSVIDEVARARVRLDLREIDTSARQSEYLGLEAILANGSIAENVTLEPKIVKVTPLVASSPQQKPVQIYPQITGAPPLGYIMAGYEIEPNPVMLRGTSRVLAGVTQITTEPVDVAGLTEDRNFVVSLRIPQGLSMVGSPRVKVRVIINPAPPTNNNSEGQ